MKLEFALAEFISKYSKAHIPIGQTMTSIKEKMAERTKFTDDFVEREERLERMKKGIGDLLNLARCT